MNDMQKTNILLQLLFMVFFANMIYSCKKEPKDVKDARKNTSSIKKDSSAVKTVENAKNNEMVYEEVKSLKKIGSYADGPMQSLDLLFTDHTFKIRYIEDRAYIQYVKDGKTIQDWQFCNVNFYYDSSYKIAEEEAYLLYNDETSSGMLLFIGFTEEYPTYFAYEFNDNECKYKKEITLENTLSLDVWSNKHTFKAIRDKNGTQIILTDYKGREYMFSNGTSGYGSLENTSLSKDMLLLKNEK